MSLHNPPAYQDELSVPGMIQLDPTATNLEPSSHLHAKAAKVQFHKMWPKTDVWRYEEAPDATVFRGTGPAEQADYSYLGPTLIVEGGSPLDQATAAPFDITWHNDIFSGPHHHTEYPVDVDYTFLPGGVSDDDAGATIQASTTNVPNRNPDAKPPFDESPLGMANAAVYDRLSQIKDLPSALVAHFHGGETEADSDGWTDNVKLHGQIQRGHFRHAQRACMLWYHDHAMGVTRLNVMAGLAGLVLVRDKRDRKLRRALADEHGFADGENFMTYSRKVEIPILLQDRNFNLGPNTNDEPRTAQLLHKTRKDLMEFFGPYTVVNGKVWPFQKVEPLHYRLRLINGANARTFGLRFVEIRGKNEVVPLAAGTIMQIGTDQGPLTLGTKGEMGVDISQTPLVLAPAERADVIIDFTKLAGKTIRVLNLAKAPYGTSSLNTDGLVPLPTTHVPNQPTSDPDKHPYIDMLPFYDVMQFEVNKKGGPAKPFALKPDFFAPPYNPTSGTEPKPLRLLNYCTGPDCCVPGHDHPATPDCVHQVRRLILKEDAPQFNGDPSSDPEQIAEASMLSLYELEPCAKETPDCFSITENGKTEFYCPAAKMFYETINWHIAHNSVEEWRIYNVSPDTHPIHVHLVAFEVLGRSVFTYTEETEPGSTIVIKRTIDLPMDVSVQTEDAELRGRKDTVRANPGEVTVIRMQFTGHCGRYMYHCHILEHEDHEMMRPFVVMPGSLMAQMPGHASHGGHMAMPAPAAPPLAEAPGAGHHHHV